MQLPVDGDDGAVFHLMRRVLQQHGARWAAALPEMTKAQWAVLRAADDDRCDQNTVGERTAIDKATLGPSHRPARRPGLADARHRPGRPPTPAAAADRAPDAQPWRRATPIVAAVDAAALDDLDAAERARLRTLLTRLV